MAVFTLMLTSTGGDLSPQLIRLAQTSQRHKIRVVAVDNRANVVSRHIADAFHTVPRGDDPGYAEAVKAIVQREGVNLIIPGADEEAMALSAAAADFAALDCKLAVSDHAVMQIISNKGATLRALAAAGVPVPRWREVTEHAALADAVADATRVWGDVVVKPSVARGGRGVSVVGTNLGSAGQGAREVRVGLDDFLRDGLAAYKPQMPVIVMERLQEPVHDIDILAWEGKPIHLVPRRRVSSTLPNAGHVFIDSAPLVQLGDVVARALKLTWLYDCDVMHDAAGTPWILEVNPRPSGSWAVTIIAGVPLLDNVVSLAKGDELVPAESPVGRTVMPFQSLWRI